MALTTGTLGYSAYLLNVGRGTLVDTDALVREVASGRLRAALDGFDAVELEIGRLSLRKEAGE